MGEQNMQSKNVCCVSRFQKSVIQNSQLNSRGLLVFQVVQISHGVPVVQVRLLGEESMMLMIKIY